MCLSNLTPFKKNCGQCSLSKGLGAQCICPLFSGDKFYMDELLKSFFPERLSKLHREEESGGNALLTLAI